MYTHTLVWVCVWVCGGRIYLQNLTISYSFIATIQIISCQDYCKSHLTISLISPPPSLFSGDHHTIVCIYEFVCSILFYIPCANEIIWLLSFSLWFISVNMRLSRSTHVVEMAIFNIPLYIRTTSSLSNHRSQDTWVVFMSSPQWIMLQWR